MRLQVLSAVPPYTIGPQTFEKQCLMPACGRLSALAIGWRGSTVCQVAGGRMFRFRG
jgi:hypothetical protein